MSTPQNFDFPHYVPLLNLPIANNADVSDLVCLSAGGGGQGEGKADDKFVTPFASDLMQCGWLLTDTRPYAFFTKRITNNKLSSKMRRMSMLVIANFTL